MRIGLRHAKWSKRSRVEVTARLLHLTTLGPVGQRQRRCIASTSNLSRTALGTRFRLAITPSCYTVNQPANISKLTAV